MNLREQGVREVLSELGLPDDEGLALLRLVQGGSEQQAEAFVRLIAYASGWCGRCKAEDEDL